jgi:PucR C-terminal helix-turn-helix domain/GGDEF-like domain
VTDATTTATLGEIAERILAQRDDLAEAALGAIVTEAPSYARVGDATLIDDLREHLVVNIALIAETLAEGRSVTSEDLSFVRRHATLRARRGVALEDFLHAYRIGHRVVWQAVMKWAREEQSRRDAALDATERVMDFIDHASTHAAAAYVEARQLLVAEGDRVRRDVLEDLLAGRDLEAGPKRSAALGAGLEATAACMLVVAVPVVPAEEEYSLRSAAARLARALQAPLPPLTVVRQDEIVIAGAPGDRAPAEVVPSLRTAWDALAAEGVRLAVAVSTARERPAELGSAYAEASAALGHLPPQGGVLGLPELSAFDYLMLQAPDTAARLVRPEVRRFVAEDLAQDGTLVRTIAAYAAADLNVKVAAERLFVHVNTAHHRLGRIEERTGCDLRSLADVQELLIAIRLAERPST